MTTLLDLRTEVRQRTNQEANRFYQDSEVNTYLSRSYGELYGLVAGKFEDYFVGEPVTLTVAVGAVSAPLPADFFKLIGMDMALGNEWVEIHPYNFQKRNRQRGVERLVGIYPAVGYRLFGSEIRFTPEDQAPGTYRMWYVPRCPGLVNDTDAVDQMIDVNGWTEYVVADAAIKMLAKEETDVSVFLQQKAAVRQRIIEEAANRDAGETERISDVQGSHGRRRF